MVKVTYFSQLIIHDDFINSLLPVESAFVSSIWDAGLHGSVLLKQPGMYSELFRGSKIEFFAKIVND